MALAAAPEADRDISLVRKLRRLYQLARDGKRNKYDGWMRNYRVLHNRQGGTSPSSWQPSPRDSEVYPTLSSLNAWMTDQHTNISITAAADPNSDYYTFMQQRAMDLETIMQTNWAVLDYDTQVKMVIWDAFLYGAGFFKNVWDAGLDDGYGNALLKRVDPWALYIDPNATSLDDAEYIIEARRMSLDEIERKFPESSTLLESIAGDEGDAIDEKPDPYNVESSRIPKANPGGLPGSGTYGGGFGASSPGTRYASPSSRNRNSWEPLPGIVVYEFWLKENDEWIDDEENEKNIYAEKQIAEKWRVVVLASNQILMDEDAEDLFANGKHPYERYVFEEIGELYGIAIVDHLAQPQIYINRLLTALQQNAELVGNPIFIEGTNSGLDRVNIVNRPGTRLKINAAAMQQRPDWLQPPQMPDSVRQLVDFWIQRIENISGLSAATKGAQSPARTAEGVIQTIQESAFVRVRAALANLESTLKRCARKLADLIIDNYNDPRTLAIIGPQGNQTSMVLQSRHFEVPTEQGAAPLKYQLLVQAGASMPTSRQARVAEADKAYALGLIDRQAWFEAHQYPNWQTVLKRVNDQIASGQFNPPGARQRAGRSK